MFLQIFGFRNYGLPWVLEVTCSHPTPPFLLNFFWDAAKLIPKKDLFFWPFVVVFFCSPLSSSSSNSDHKKHRDFHNLCPLFLSLVNKRARTHTNTRAEEAALETELSQSLQQKHTAPQLLHHHHRRQSVSQSVRSPKAKTPDLPNVKSHDDETQETLYEKTNLIKTTTEMMTRGKKKKTNRSN